MIYNNNHSQHDCFKILYKLINIIRIFITIIHISDLCDREYNVNDVDVERNINYIGLQFKGYIENDSV